MKKYLLFAATLLLNVASFAQWVKPAAPAAEPLKAGEECYLYNKDADGFLLGANDWGTRASVSNTLGHKVILENGTIDGSYYITNYVLQGGMKDQWGYMFMEGVDQIWVDNTKDGKKDNQYTFEALGDNLFKIGLSEANEKIKASEGFEGAYLGTKADDLSDNRIYIIEAGVNGLLTWCFVTPANYEAYVTKVLQYNAAVALGEVITEAEATEGTDATVLADAKTVYNNTSSTAEELAAAQKKLEEAVKNAKYNLASLENPIEVLKMQGIATDFTDGTCPGWSSTTGATNKQASNGNNAKDYSVTGNHYENWNGSAFTPGTISATATDIPVGVYHLNALAFTNTGDCAYLFAGNDRTAVDATQIDIEKSFNAWAFSTDGTLKIGLDIPEKGPNWVGLDNVNLFYVGAKAEAIEHLYNYISDRQKDYASLKEEGEVIFSNALYEEYASAKEAFEAAKDKSAEEFGVAYNAYYTTLNALEANVEAFAPYTALVKKANEWRSTTSSSSDEVVALGDYLDDDTEPQAGMFNGNGGAKYIAAEGALTAEQIAAEVKYLEKLLNDAMANSMADGDDCTSLLKNPDFTDATGWTFANTDVPTGLESFRVFQSWGKVCDVNQSLTGLQNGIYEMNIQSVYKPDNDLETYQCYAYINDFDTKVNLPADDDQVGSADDASARFAEGKYPVKVYGLVTENTMKLGIANRLRTGENGVLWAGGVKLTFRAKNAEACSALLAELKTEAEGLAEKIYGEEESSALASALENAAGVSGDEGYDALVALKAALDAANEGVSLYADLELALKNLREAIDTNTKADKMTISKAETLYEETLAAYTDKSLNNEAAAQAVSDVKAMTVSIKMGGEKATEDNPVDYSSAIVNNNFDPAKGNKDEKRIDGWNVSGALNGYKKYTASFNKGTFNLSQTISGLPKGKYKVTVHTFYRAGSYEEEEAAINSGADTHLCKLYAGDQETAVVNLSEGAKGITIPEGVNTKTINGITVPDGTDASVACFNAGYYLNELPFTVGEDGEVTIGLKLDQTIGTNDYVVVGEWNLWYMGDPTGGQTIEDYTSVIVNSDFDPAKGSKDEKRIDGWVVSGALNGYKKNTASFNKGTFDLHQDLAGLPEGEYKVTVHTFYRAGSYEEEEAAINSGADTHLCKLYGGDQETAVVNLSEGAKAITTMPEGINTKTINGITVPDGTDASVACFNAGYYVNELKFTVGADGKTTIGLKLEETIGTNDYVVVGSWNLYYLGKAQGTKEDVSSLIVNNDFDPAKGNKDEKRIDGWDVEGALNGYKKYTASFNKGTFKLSQKLAGLPKGKYEVTVHTFYRAGSYEEEEAAINSGKDTHLCKLFAGDKETAVVNLSEGAKEITEMPEGINTKTINGITVPDGTDASVACFNAGYYLNTLQFTVGADGEATIGLKLEETIGTNDYVVVGCWNLYYYGEEKTEELDENDVTSLIVNNDFNPEKGNKDEKRINGWNVSGALNGYKKYTASFNKGTFDLNQQLEGLPEGTYKVTVHTFYRAGSYEEEEAAINSGAATHLCKLYANAAKEYVKPVVNLSEGAVGITIPEGVNTKTINGITVPDGTDASVACFNAGYYLNELPFYVDNTGKATIGLKLEETIGTNDYVVVGCWNLYYYGSGDKTGTVTEIEEVESAPVLVELVPVAYYSISGARLSTPQKGINIVKMSNGSTIKMMVK